MPNELGFYSLTHLARMLDDGATSSREIVEACLANISSLDGHLHAFVEVYGDSALAAADTADAERVAGASRGLLHGLPIALKDLLHIRGKATTAGSKSCTASRSDPGGHGSA